MTLFKQNRSNLLKVMLFCLLVLTWCKAFANVESTNSDEQSISQAKDVPPFKPYDKYIAYLEVLKDTHPPKAFEEITRKASQVASLTIEQQIQFYFIQTEVLLALARYSDAIESGNHGLNIVSRDSRPSQLISELRYATGFAYESIGDHQTASEYYELGLEIAYSLNDKKNIANGLINLGALAYQVRKFDQALTLFNDALTIAKDTQDHGLLGYINSELGILYGMLNQTEQSLDFYLSAKHHYQQSGKLYLAYTMLREIALGYFYLEQYDKAIKSYQEIIANTDNLSSNEFLSLVYSGMAWAHYRKPDSNPEAAYRYMNISSEFAIGVEQVDVPILNVLDKGFLFLELGKLDEALEAAQEADRLITKYPDFLQRANSSRALIDTLYLKAKVYYQQEMYQQAYEAQSKLIALDLQRIKSSNVDIVEDARLKYESQQQDIENKLMAQQKAVQGFKLLETNSEIESRRWLVVILGAISVVLAWLVWQSVKGQHKLLVASRTDPLTGITNRRRLMEVIALSFAHARTRQWPISLVMMDVDDFKKINDRFGHQVGDKVLCHIANFSKNMKRVNDTIGRFGGEEFVAVLPETDIEQAKSFCHRLQSSLNETSWGVANLEEVTISFGIASVIPGKSDDHQTLLKRADQQLYRAKRQGKNQVCYEE